MMEPITIVVPGAPRGKGRGSPMKATSEQLLESYARTGSVHKTGAEFGMSGGSVHERLQSLGVTCGKRWTDMEKDRLRAEYPAAAAAGKLEALWRLWARRNIEHSRRSGRLQSLDGRANDRLSDSQIQ